MIRPFTILALYVLSMNVVCAEDLAFAFEGNPQLRERLSDLQDNNTPPALQVTDWLNSEALTLKELRGKIVVLDFWATWCGPCISSIPHNNEIYKKYKDKVVFIGVCHPRGVDKMAKVVQDKGILYPVVADNSGKTASAYKVNGYPDYYIFDKEGTLVVADCANSKVEAVIEKLLAE